MKTSESLLKFAPAFLKAQQNMEAAKKGSINPFFRSTYADLGSVLEACKPQLNNEGISIIQGPFVRIEGELLVDVIATRLLHTSGEFIEIETRVEKSKSNDPQSKLAGETYTRRGSLQSLVALPAEDDDGNTASGNKTAKKVAKKVTKKISKTSDTSPNSGEEEVSRFKRTSTTKHAI